MTRTFLLFGSCFYLIACTKTTSTDQYVNWAHYLGDQSTNQYSPLTLIHKENVKELEQVWSYQTGDADSLGRSQIQCNPLVIDGVLYGSTAKLQFFALDASTGEEIWRFDPFADHPYDQFGMGVNRGLAYWTDGKEERLLFTASSFLYAVDAKTGNIITGFGEQGRVDLHEGLDRDVTDQFIVSNTPGIVYKDKLILGMRVAEGTGAAPGHIRAYNIHTGSREWIFHTIPQEGEFGTETWPKGASQYAGGANAWAGMSLDEKRGIVFIPTGSASFDFYGGDRHGENLFANCLLALNAETGERIWHYQTVRHDLWDRDLPCPPNLIQLEKNGKTIDAVAQLTKSAHIFVFDRVNGEPLFPIEEVEVPASDLEGEIAWPTQPIPSLPQPFARSRMEEKDITKRTPEAHEYVKNIWKNLREGAPFVPPSKEGSIIFPGLDGGGEWGGGAFDPETANLIINASEMPWILQMLPFEQTEQQTKVAVGKGLYQSYCLSCHGPDLKGGTAFANVPSLEHLNERFDQIKLAAILERGKGAMPAFGFLSSEQVDALSTFLLELDAAEELAKEETAWPYPYYLNGYRRFEDQDGYPAITPPWGTLNAVNLQTGALSWKVTLGSFAELESAGGAPTGSESYGGPVVTAGGLVFIAATPDQKLRVFDKDTGELLVEKMLPAAGFATPAVYAIEGKQYVVIACGGGKLRKPSGDTYVAFSLSER